MTIYLHAKAPWFPRGLSRKLLAHYLVTIMIDLPAMRSFDLLFVDRNGLRIS